MVAARIIKQYVSYWKEIEFNHLSERELYRVLKYCPAQQKKALQGLDNISADGLRGVGKLENVIRKLGERDESSEWVTGVINLLMAFKSYLKESYRLHVFTSLRYPDHCSMFALSDPSEPEFSEECNHAHDLVCNDCERLYYLEVLMKNAFSDPQVEDKLHDVLVSLESIYAWKSHLLRVVHQDRARQEVLDEVDSSKIFITQDFAMKFLPRRFKETQMEWFGKRGISWHISHCVRRTGSNECEVSVYSHLFRQSISQNSEVVAAVMRHTLQEEKARHPENNEAFYQSDCTGSYASGGLLVPMRHIGKLIGFSIKRYDFSPPQILLHNYHFCNDGLKVWKYTILAPGNWLHERILKRMVKYYYPLNLEFIESRSQGNSQSVKKDNTCLAAELPGLVTICKVTRRI